MGPRASRTNASFTSSNRNALSTTGRFPVHRADCRSASRPLGWLPEHSPRPTPRQYDFSGRTGEWKKPRGPGSGGGDFPAHRPVEPGVPVPEGVLQARRPDLKQQVGAAPVPPTHWLALGHTSAITRLTIDSATAVEISAAGCTPAAAPADWPGASAIACAAWPGRKQTTPATG